MPTSDKDSRERYLWWTEGEGTSDRQLLHKALARLQLSWRPRIFTDQQSTVKMVKDRNSLLGGKEPVRVAASSLPYPVTPASPRPQSQGSEGRLDHSLEGFEQTGGSGSIANDPDLNEKILIEDFETTKPQDPEVVPEALRVGKRKSAEQPPRDNEIPTALRVGRPAGVPDTFPGQAPSGIAPPIWQNPKPFTASVGMASQAQSLDTSYPQLQDSHIDGGKNSYTSNASIWQQHQTAGTRVLPHQRSLSNSQGQYSSFNA